MELKPRIINYVIVAFLGAALGVLAVGVQFHMNKFFAQQEQILRLEKRLEQVDSVKAGDWQAMEAKQKALEEKIADLEKAVKDAGQVQRAPQPPQEDFTKVYDIPVGHSPVLGSKDAKVTIVEFVDFQCPYCARFHGPAQEMLKMFPKDVNYMLKNFPLPFHPNARPAAKAALAAGEQGKYYEMANALIENRKDLGDALYEKLAKDLGLNVKKFLKDLKNNDELYEKYLKEDAELTNKVNVRGTPTFFINGRKTRARDVDSFKKEIEKNLKEKE